VVFTSLSLAVASAGYILSGGYGVQDFSRTAVSLVQLVLLLVPLASLVFGGLALTPDRGFAELLYSQPAARAVILIGRMMGVWLALGAAQLVGFGLAGLVVQSQVGVDGLWRYGVLVLTALAVTGVFVAIATLLASVGAGRRTRVLATALVVWFFIAVLFDVIALGVASLLRSDPASRLLVLSVLVNPVDAARTGALLAIEGTAAFGAASLALLRFTGGMAMAAGFIGLSLVVWLLTPLWLAARAVSRVDI
jgi:Cu-processing system permease protein